MTAVTLLDLFLSVIAIIWALGMAVQLTYFVNHGHDWDVALREDFYDWLDKPNPKYTAPDDDPREDSGPDYDYDDETAAAVEAARERYTDPDDEYTILDYENDLEDILDDESDTEDEDDEDEDEEPEEPPTADRGGGAVTTEDVHFEAMKLQKARAMGLEDMYREARDEPHDRQRLLNDLYQTLNDLLYHGEPVPATPTGTNRIVGAIHTTLERYHPNPHVDFPINYPETGNVTCEFTVPGIAIGEIEINSAGVNIRVDKHTEPVEVEAEPTVEREHIVENTGVSVSRYSHHVKIALPDTDPHRHTLSDVLERGSTLNIAVENDNGDTVTYHDAAVTEYSHVGAALDDPAAIGSVVYDIEATRKSTGRAPVADIDLTTDRDPEPELDGQMML